MNRKIFIALAMLGIFNQPKAQNINIYSPGEGEGIAYFLPKTALEVNIIAQKVKYTPGDFCQYANRYLRINNVTSSPSTHWEIKQIDIKPIGIPDSTKAYIIKLSDKSVLSNIEVTEDGIIRAINTSAPTIQSPQYKLEKIQPAENGRKYMTEEILSAGSTAKMAELTAKEIYNIRESKNLILRGQADNMPKDGASLKLIMENLDKQEKALVAMFTGTETIEEKLFTTQIQPEEATTNQIVMRFSQKIGVLSADNLAGDPIYISIESISPIPQTNPVTDEKKKKKKLKGVLYNIPGKANVIITFKGKKLLENNNISFSQFGNTELLVNDLFSKKANAKVIFDTTTGGIQKIEME